MSSSTSSSDPAAPAPRGPYLRALLVVLLGMGASAGLVRLFMAIGDVGAETILEGPSQALAHLPAILDEEAPLVMAFGSSMTEAGFSPRQFDAELAERGLVVKSWNFGFGGLNPYFQDYLSRRIRDAFQARDRRLELSLIEFTPLQNTQARWRGAQPAVDSFVTMLGTGPELWELTKEDPTRGARLLQIKYLRNEVSAEITTWHFGGQIFSSGRPESDLPRDEEKQRLLEEIGTELNAAFAEDYPDHEPCDWCWKWQGGGTIPSERSPETLAKFVAYWDAARNEKRLTEDRLWRIDCCDIEELRFEEALVAAFIRTVRNFQEFSEHVEVILMPRNRDWIGRTPEAEERLRVVLARIEAETGVRVRSFEDAPEIRPDMFSDTTHLARYQGDVAYTSLLVDTYGPLLGAEPAADAVEAPGSALTEAPRPAR